MRFLLVALLMVLAGQALAQPHEGMIAKSGLPVTIVETPEQSSHSSEREAASDKHDAVDLKAQERAADAAAESAASADRQEYLARWQLGLSAFGVVSLIVTIIYSIRATNAAVRSADLAERAIVAAEEMGHRELRAYVDVAESRFEGGPFDPLIVVSVKNFGQTPAKDLQVRTVFDVGREPLPEPVLPEAWRPATGIPLAPGNEWTFRYQYVVQRALDAEGGEPMARITGEVKYIDVTGEKRETHFRIRTAGHRLDENMVIFPDATGNHST
ncbi:hypothetical protein [Mesorhizobium sp.]|uniref:hypothetical protein n=1 Tax=Mesorhizobium sp. TaxID=1871066 RepID=UPI000FE7EA4D|nr:hypothetical protein [Mesorhizobium sp.]RWD79485.1 MAG: hypothetical protein EOS39_32580 [Mesorhizobium sp.]